MHVDLESTLPAAARTYAYLVLASPTAPRSSTCGSTRCAFCAVSTMCSPWTSRFNVSLYRLSDLDLDPIISSWTEVLLHAILDWAGVPPARQPTLSTPRLSRLLQSFTRQSSPPHDSGVHQSINQWSCPAPERLCQLRAWRAPAGRAGVGEWGARTAGPALRACAVSTP